MRVAIATVGVLFLASMRAGADPPAGWRYPNSSEVSQSWRTGGSHRYLVVAADFDADKLPDRAELLVSKAGRGAALVVTLGRKPGHPIVVERLADVAQLDVMGISLAEPGQYKTACGKGYWECGPGEPELLDLKVPGIDLFMSESANSFFVFDQATRGFHRIWMSD